MSTYHDQLTELMYLMEVQVAKEETRPYAYNSCPAMQLHAMTDQVDSKYCKHSQQQAQKSSETSASSGAIENSAVVNLQCQQVLIQHAACSVIVCSYKFSAS